MCQFLIWYQTVNFRLSHKFDVAGFRGSAGRVFLLHEKNLVLVLEQYRWNVQSDLWAHDGPVPAQVETVQKGSALRPAVEPEEGVQGLRLG